MRAMIELRGAGRSFGPAVALRPTDLVVESGKTTVLIGPSGCGKSTLLRLVVGLLRPTTGEVLFEGQPIREENLIQIRRRMGYVIQDGGLFPHLTAGQNVLLMARHTDFPRPEALARLKVLCELTHFPTDGLTRYPV